MKRVPAIDLARAVLARGWWFEKHHIIDGEKSYLYRVIRPGPAHGGPKPSSRRLFARTTIDRLLAAGEARFEIKIDPKSESVERRIVAA